MNAAVRRWLPAGLALLLAVGAALAFVPWGGTAEGGLGAKGGDSDSAFLAAAQAGGRTVRVVTSTPLAVLDRPGMPDGAALVVLGAQRAYSAAEADAIDRFLEAGGKALVADDRGLGSSLTARHGVSFERVPLLHDGTDVPLAFNLSGASVPVAARLPSALLLRDTATADAAGANAADAAGPAPEVVASTDRLTFEDRDGDGAVGPSDPAGPFAVAVRVPVGAKGGELWVLGSRDLLSDRAASDPAVQAWRAALLAELAPGDAPLVLDESHLAQAGPAGASAVVIRAFAEPPGRWAVAAGALLAALALAFLAAVPSAWGPHRHEPDRYRSRREAAARGVAAPGARDPEADAPARLAWTWRAVLAGGAAVVLVAGGAALGQGSAIAGGLALAALLVLSSTRPRPSAEATRTVSNDRVPEGQSVAVEVELRPRRGGTVEARDGVPAEAEVQGAHWLPLHLRRGRPATVRYELRPHLRGPHQVGPLRLRSADPLRLRTWDVPVGEPAHVRVLPRREPLKRFRLKVRRPEILMGAHPVNRAGEGTEFQALREYQPGDALRTVNWKASARSKSLMVNQRVLESQTVLTLVLDARAVSDCGPARSTPLAASARALLTAAGAAANGRDRLRFVSYGAAIDELPPGSSQRFMHELGDRLAGLPASGDLPFSRVADHLLSKVRPGTPVALFSGLEGDGGFAEGARTLLARGATVTVFAFPVDASGEPAADAILASRQRNVEALRGTGAIVHEVPGDMPLEALLRLQGVSR